MAKLRMAIVGAGGMANMHAGVIQKIEEVQLTAVADINVEAAQRLAAKHSIRAYGDHKELLKKERPDFVLVVTPHPIHPVITVDAFKAGAHVLSEKPMASNPADADRMIAAAEKHGKLLGVMFQQRTEAPRRKLRDMVQGGELGAVYRVEMVSTWYRSQAYYDSGTWRGTWAGEGGGVLLNQAPHDLDQFVWITGVPAEVAGVVETRLHSIEVEDSASALVRYANGARGYFHTSTVEQPEVYRLEICGDRGKVLFDGRTIRRWTLPAAISEVTSSTKESMPASGAKEEVVEVPAVPAGHGEMTRDFAKAIMENRQPLAPGREAIVSLELAAAMILSSHRARPVSLPLNRGAYSRFLREKCRTSRFKG